MIASVGPALPANARNCAVHPVQHAAAPRGMWTITNGGYGGVEFLALADGVPLIVAGATSRRSPRSPRGWPGAARASISKPTRPHPIRFCAAVETILLIRLHRPRQAERIRAEYARHNPPHEAAALLERLAVMWRLSVVSSAWCRRRSLRTWLSWRKYWLKCPDQYSLRILVAGSL